MVDGSVYTFLSWAAVVAGGIALFGYYRPDLARKIAPASLRDSSPRAAKNHLFSDGEGNGNGNKKRKRDERRAARPKPAAKVESVETPSRSYESVKGEKEDKTWATRLVKAREGTKLSAPTRSATQSKTVKQRNANNRAAEMSAGSSSNGGDTDDDLSPAASPTVNGFHNEPSGKNIHDMLEPTANGPSVLKLTEPTNPKAQKPKHQKVEQKQETKKDRQNKRKAEEKKAQREADEKERKALEEKQRRSAREARGEPAKNGLGVSSAPVNNAWNGKAANGTSPILPPATYGELLDTFAEDNPISEGTKPTDGTDRPVNGHPKWWEKEKRTEGEQMKVLTEADDTTWNTVASKKKRKGPQNGGAVQPVEETT